MTFPNYSEINFWMLIKTGCKWIFNCDNYSFIFCSFLKTDKKILKSRECTEWGSRSFLSQEKERIISSLFCAEIIFDSKISVMQKIIIIFELGFSVIRKTLKFKSFNFMIDTCPWTVEKGLYSTYTFLCEISIQLR